MGSSMPAAARISRTFSAALAVSATSASVSPSEEDESCWDDSSVLVSVDSSMVFALSDALGAVPEPSSLTIPSWTIGGNAATHRVDRHATTRYHSVHAQDREARLEEDLRHVPQGAQLPARAG